MFFRGHGADSDIVFLAVGLLYLNFTPSERWAEQRTTFRSSPLLTIFWIASLLFVLGAPFIKNNQLNAIPYWVVPTLGTSMLAIGVVYWLVWAKVLPLLGFHIQHEIVQMPDGSERVKYKVSGLLLLLFWGRGRVLVLTRATEGEAKEKEAAEYGGGETAVGVVMLGSLPFFGVWVGIQLVYSAASEMHN